MQSGHGNLRWTGVVLLMLALVSLGPTNPVRAATIIVDTAGDGDVPANASHCPSLSPAHTCTLRDAVAKSISGDTINFASGLGTIHVTHAGGTIMIGHDLTIAGQGATTTIIDAEANTQPFAITGPNTSSTGTPITINAAFQDLTIQNVNITDGVSLGGAILVQSDGTLTLTRVNFLNNSDANGGVYGGGAIFLNSFLRPPLATTPLLSASLIITNCTFDGNQTDWGGAAIEWNGPITITNSTFTNNAANGNGGGADGGAILDGLSNGGERSNPATGIVTVSNSTFTNNSSLDGDGGAISANAVVATNVTFNNNQTINGLGGGAIELHLYPSTGSPPPSKIVNATFDGNVAGLAGSGSGEGGAIAILNGALTLLNVTITNNSVGVVGGGVSVESGSLTLGNTIIAGNSTSIGSPDVSGSVTSLGHNLVSVVDCGCVGFTGAGDKTGGPNGNTPNPAGSNLPLDAQINPLGNNGGTTQTRLPLPGSPALDAGDDTICNQIGLGAVNKLDQRGTARPIGAHCDIGATEGTSGLIVPVAGTTPQQAAVGAAFAPALAAIIEDAGGTHLGSGISVTFTVVPVGGAGGSFPGNATTATVTTDVNGVATAPALTANATPGSYTVTANLTSGPLGTPAIYTLTNTAVTLTAIAVTAPGGITNPTVKVGQTVQLTATGTFSDGSTHPLTAATWVSSNPQAISVDSTGKITVLGQGGPVTITATLNGVSGQIIVTIGTPILTGVAPAPAPAARPSGATTGLSGSPAANPLPPSR